MFYTFNQLSVYRFVFLLELILAEFFFCHNLKRNNYFWLRFAICFSISCLLIFFFPIINYEPFNISLLFIFIYLCNVISCKVMFKEKWQTVLFCTLASYTVQHIAYAVYNLLVDNLYLGKIMDYFIETNPYFANNQKEGVGYSFITFIVYAWVYFSVYWVSARMLASKIKKDSNVQINHNSLIFLSMILLFVDIYFNLLTVFYNTDSLFSLVEGILNIFVCLLALLLQFTQLRVTEMTDELNSIKSIWAERNKQYEMSKKNIEIINIKCHDLKHQIHKIGKKESIDQNEMKQIEEAVSFYDMNAKTGNEALDVILTEKALLCEKNHIELTMIVDGESISFISPRDIYSLFGNALDNAIEALEHVEEGKRNISLYVKKKMNFISIHIENYFVKDVQIKNNTLITSKEDSSLHGFGFLSMQEITNRYNGTMTYKADNHLFSLDFLFPIS